MFYALCCRGIALALSLPSPALGQDADDPPWPIELTAAKFPELEGERVDTLSRFLERALPQWNITLNLDRLLAELDRIHARAASASGIKNEPPEIVYLDHPAVLVPIGGDPLYADLKGADLKYVVNSVYYILRDPSGTYFLKSGDSRYRAGQRHSTRNAYRAQARNRTTSTRTRTETSTAIRSTNGRSGTRGVGARAGARRISIATDPRGAGAVNGRRRTEHAGVAVGAAADRPRRAAAGRYPGGSGR